MFTQSEVQFLHDVWKSFNRKFNNGPKVTEYLNEDEPTGRIDFDWFAIVKYQAHHHGNRVTRYDVYVWDEYTAPDGTPDVCEVPLVFQCNTFPEAVYECILFDLSQIVQRQISKIPFIREV